VLNWAAYGLYQDQSYHLLSAEEVADKKKLDKKASDRRYRATPKGKESIRRNHLLNNASEVSKQSKRQYAASDVGKESKRKYEASDVGKETKRKYEAAGNKRVWEFLEARENSKRHAVQAAEEDQRAQLRRPGGLAGRELVSTWGVIVGYWGVIASLDFDSFSVFCWR
jgi:hypothetical protein